MSLKIKLPESEKRSLEQLREHYQVEKVLARKLRNSTKQERQQAHLYTALYDELFRRISHHSHLTRKGGAQTISLIAQRVKFLSNFFKPSTRFLEIGCGNCQLSFAASEQVKQVFAVDVSEEITKGLDFPDNCQLIISDGVSIPIPENSVDVAYSHQLMEHLHPDDAVEQLQNIYNVLTDGGAYICVTPNRLCGPHDISKYFDEVATGFHIKEYSVSELYTLFRQAKFSKISLYKSQNDTLIKIPLFPIIVFLFKICETLTSALPFSIKRKVANTPMLFRSITIVGIK